MDRHTKEQRSNNMRAVKNKDSKIEITLRKALWQKGLRYRKNYSKVFGRPDIVFISEKIAIFCDSEFWHGYNWESRKFDFKSKQGFWIPKIEKNMKRDKEVNMKLQTEGYKVMRFWGKDIEDNLDLCIREIIAEISIRRVN